MNWWIKNTYTNILQKEIANCMYLSINLLIKRKNQTLFRKTFFKGATILFGIDSRHYYIKLIEKRVWLNQSSQLLS